MEKEMTNENIFKIDDQLAQCRAELECSDLDTRGVADGVRLLKASLLTIIHFDGVGELHTEESPVVIFENLQGHEGGYSCWLQRVDDALSSVSYKKKNKKFEMVFEKWKGAHMAMKMWIFYLCEDEDYGKTS